MKVLKTVLCVGALLAVVAGGGLGWWSAQKERALRDSLRAEEKKIDPELIDSQAYADLGSMLHRLGKGKVKYPPLLSRLGYYYKNLDHRTREDDETIFRIFRTLAEDGNVPAMCEVANLYRIGHGTPTNHVQSVFWYRKAHEAKSPYGAFGLANAYRLGRGVERDIPRAVALFKEAEGKGVGGAAYELGEIYERGLLGKVDLAEAIRWHRRSLQARFNHFGHREMSEAALKRLERAPNQGR